MSLFITDNKWVKGLKTANWDFWGKLFWWRGVFIFWRLSPIILNSDELNSVLSEIIIIILFMIWYMWNKKIIKNIKNKIKKYIYIASEIIFETLSKKKRGTKFFAAVLILWLLCGVELHGYKVEWAFAYMGTLLILFLFFVPFFYLIYYNYLVHIRLN